MTGGTTGAQKGSRGAVPRPRSSEQDERPGTPGRLAVPVAADFDDARAVGMRLVEDTGFDAVDGGALAGSWRQQPGTSVYCTELTRE